MQPTSADTSGRLVNVYTNDPNALGLTLEQVAPPAGPLRFIVPGWIGDGGLADPGTAEFQAGQLAVVLERTLSAWCDFFGSEITWQSGAPRLPISPQAGKDFNAYYDRQGLKFFYNDAATGGTIYACESSDVVAHECGHAILDAQHPDYWDSLLGETAAFHEAFGDISAMLVTLGDPAVRAAILQENNGDLTKSNAVTRLAEQLARGVYDSGKRDSVVSQDALRDAVNKFRYHEPDKLPARAPAAKLSSESHNFSRVFSAAFYDFLVGVYTQACTEESALSGVEALDRARTICGHILARGVTLAPQGDAPYKTIAASMVTADAQDFAGKYYVTLNKAFVGRGILAGRDAEALRQSQGVGHTQTSALGMASAAMGASRMEVAEVQPGEELPSPLRTLLQLPDHDFRLVQEQPVRDSRRVLHYTAPRRLRLTGRELGIARDAEVTVSDAVAISLDQRGQVVSSHHHAVNRVQEARIRSHVARLIERGRVYSAIQGEQVTSALLIERKQPYYVAYDKDGSKRIRRGFIACGLE